MKESLVSFSPFRGLPGRDDASNTERVVWSLLRLCFFEGFQLNSRGRNKHVERNGAVPLLSGGPLCSLSCFPDEKEELFDASISSM